MQNRQLQLFEQEQRRGHVPLNAPCYMAAGLVMKYGGNDFCFFNPLGIELKECKPKYDVLKIGDTDFWNRIKSLTWSANCNFFITVNEDEMILGTAKSRKAIRMNLSSKAIEQFLRQKAI